MFIATKCVTNLLINLQEIRIIWCPKTAVYNFTAYNRLKTHAQNPYHTRSCAA